MSIRSLWLVALWLLIGPNLFAESPLRVMSFNIRYLNSHDGENHWNKRRAFVVDVIREESPDLIGLQEALRKQLDHLKKALPDYGELGEGRDGRTKGEYAAILYRKSRVEPTDQATFWLSDTPDNPSRNWGNGLNRICTWARFKDKESGQPVYLFNTHFDHKSQSSREKSSALIYQRIRTRAHKDPFLLTGDFNAGEHNPAVLFLAEKGLRDSFRVLHPEEKEVGTFSGFRPSNTTGAKIDYIFVPEEVEVLEAAILRVARDGRTPSDHFPLTAKINLTKPAPSK